MPGVLALTGPIYAVVAVGYACTRAGLFARTDMRVFGKYVVNLALPALLFDALARRHIGEVLNPVFVGAYALGSLATFGAGTWWARRGGKPLAEAAITGMGMACPNSGFIGYPVVAQLFGPATGAVCLALAMMVENCITIPVALAVADSGGDDGASGGSRGERLLSALRRSLRSLLRNPLIWAIALGLACSLLEAPLPEPVLRTLNILAASSGALSLFVIGGSLVDIRLRGLMKDVSAVAAGKLLLHPLLVLGAVLLLPPMARELQVALVVMAAVPTMGVYPIFAQKHGLDTKAAAALLAATVASFVTLTTAIWIAGNT